MCGSLSIERPALLSCAGHKFYRALAAVVPGGHIRIGDFVFLECGNIGKLLGLFSDGSFNIVCHLEVHNALPNSKLYFDIDGYYKWVHVEEVIEAVSWYMSADHITAIISDFC